MSSSWREMSEYFPSASLTFSPKVNSYTWPKTVRLIWTDEVNREQMHTVFTKFNLMARIVLFTIEMMKPKFYIELTHQWSWMHTNTTDFGCVLYLTHPLELLESLLAAWCVSSKRVWKLYLLVCLQKQGWETLGNKPKFSFSHSVCNSQCI